MIAYKRCTENSQALPKLLFAQRNRRGHASVLNWRSSERGRAISDYAVQDFNIDYRIEKVGNSIIGKCQTVVQADARRPMAV